MLQDTACVLSPVHTAPSHTLVRLIVPLLHDAEHEFHELQSAQVAHSLVLHVTISRSNPVSQPASPMFPLAQSRVRSFDPPPHSIVQLV